VLLSFACGKSTDQPSSAGTGATGTGATGTGTTTGAGGAGSDAGAGGGGAGAMPECSTLGPLPVRTPTYFVDFDAGSDTNDGKSEATAFMHAPGDASATGNAAAVALAPGDVVLLKGGVAYEGTITITASGTATAPIVLEGGPQQGWGSGMAIVDGQDTRSLGVGVQGASYVIVEGFEVRSFDKTQSSTGISVDGGAGCTVASNMLHDIYYAADPVPGGTAWEQQFGTGISVTNSPGASVIGNSVRDCGNAGISISADGGVSVTGGAVSCNEVTNMNWGVVAALGDSEAGTHLEGISITHNYIHDFNQYYVCDAWHRDGVFVFSRPDDGTLTIDDVEIADNYFEDNTSAFGSTAWIYVEFVCTNFNIHHNLLNQSRSYYGIRILGDGFQVQGDHKIANNVIANSNGQDSAGMHIMESSGAQIMNNIFYDDDVGYMIATDSMPGAAGDYNLFFRTTSGTNVAILDAGPAESPAGGSALSLDLAGMQAHGFEAHGLYGDPLWSGVFANIVDDALAFKPQKGSPAIDHGVLLSYTQDYAGQPIPQGKGPDIGAFEQ
jgi:Right handed beta helix region